MSIVYDAGALVAAERNDRRVWADHRVRLEAGVVPATTAPVVAQVSRGPRQVQLRRFLRGCQVMPFEADQGHDIGSLLSRANMSDVVDAHVVVTAARRAAGVLTSDPRDIERLSSHLSDPIRVDRI